MRIVDVVETPLAACAQFQFQGWTVSMSTIFKGVPVCAFNDENADEIEGSTVEEVINSILIHGLKAKDKTSFISR